ncbi:MAG: phosphoribosyltransferase [Acidimicrobiia bacterium]|nr:phosphoribosyltransferase [Acidimicrobiia bacterium]
MSFPPHPGARPAANGSAQVRPDQRPKVHSARNPPRRVLIVDDVVSTGATMLAAADALRTAGAVVVKAAAAARTPLKATDELSDAAGDG